MTTGRFSVWTGPHAETALDDSPYADGPAAIYGTCSVSSQRPEAQS
jgi:hypothetical protein